MKKDLFGVNRLKINLHTHTTRSDGAKTPEEVAEIYKKAGYDVIAITDHWNHLDSGRIAGLRILSGAEYNIGGGDGCGNVFHILGIGCESKPALTETAGPQEIIDEVHRCKGLAVLAHPAWSLNTAQQAARLSGVDATEIYNSVSDAGESSRPYSGDFVDTAACQGLFYPLIADDDAHFYNGSDETKAWIMLEAEENAVYTQAVHSIGSKGEALTCVSRNQQQFIEKDADISSTYMQMDGKEVFKFAVSKVPEVIMEVLEKAGKTKEEIAEEIIGRLEE